MFLAISPAISYQLVCHSAILSSNLVKERIGLSFGVVWVFCGFGLFCGFGFGFLWFCLFFGWGLLFFFGFGFFGFFLEKTAQDS